MCLFNIIFSCCLLINQNLRLRSTVKIKKYRIKSENQSPKALLIRDANPSWSLSCRKFFKGGTKG
jgi:hypothetical protein